MAIQGAPAVMKAGGATASGPAAGIYRVKVMDAKLVESKKTKRPGLKLELHVFNDPANKAKEGKKLITQTFYGEAESDDDDKKQTMRGMLKRGPFKGFGVTWPKENKDIEARLFANKEAFVLLAPKKPENDGDDIFMEVTRISQDREPLEKAAENAAAAASSGVSSKPKKSDGGAAPRR